MTLSGWFERLERQKEGVLSDFAALPLARLRFRPEGGWSVLDVLDHVVKVERAATVKARKQLPNGTPLKLSDRLGALLVITVMKSPMRVRVPASATAVLPAEVADAAEVEGRWGEVRKDLAGLLGSLTPEQFRCGLFRHPVGGWMTMEQTLAFLSAHLRHHEYQLSRLKSLSG